MSNEIQLASRLKGIVGEANVMHDPDRLKAFAVDGVVPRAVVSPGSEEEISGLLALAKAEKLGICLRGNGTKIAAGLIPRKLDIVLSMLRINRITEHDVPNLSLSVEAGITLTALQKQLAQTGKGSFLPLDPPYTEKATIGGIVATNGSGPRRYLYNTARDLLLGVKAVLPNGDIVAFGGKTMKNVSGYDMTKLMVGSWGALGVITEITTKLLPLPEASATLLGSFDDLAKAGSLTRKVLHSVLLPSAIELMDGKAAGRLGERGATWSPSAWRGSGRPWTGRWRRSARSRRKRGRPAEGPQGGRGSNLLGPGSRFRTCRRGSGYPPGEFRHFEAGRDLGRYQQMAKAAGVECAFIGHAGNGILRCYCIGEPPRRPARSPV